MNPKWYTKKFNGPGLRCEIGICIQTGWIVWVHGPFAPGEWPDLNIALDSVVWMLEGDERIVADGGYPGYPMFFDTPHEGGFDNEYQSTRKTLVRARHECINRRLKCWQILKQVYRHDIHEHGTHFRAVANLEQLNLMEMGTQWHVNYFDRIHNDLDFDY